MDNARNVSAGNIKILINGRLIVKGLTGKGKGIIVVGKGKGNNMIGSQIKLNEVADLHNRRGNIEYVSARAKKHGFPFLVWPEDRLLLRIDDFPRTSAPRIPEDWKRIELTRQFMVKTDADLRLQVKPGYAYALSCHCRRLGVFFIVDEFKIESR